MTITDDPTTTTTGPGSATAGDAEAEAGAFAERLFLAAVGTMDLLSIHLGNRLDLYRTLRAAGPSTAGELATAGGIHPRYAREWLEQQAATGILTCLDVGNEAEERHYELPAGHALALCEPEHPAACAAFGDIIPVAIKPLDQLVEAFRTGSGVPYAAYELHDAQAAFTRPMYANDVATWVAAVPELAARLEAGETARVADVGCGEGWFAIHLARAFPMLEVDGFDLDEASIVEARRLAAAHGVADRVHFEVQDVSAPDFGRTYDLVTACEMLHDVSDPVGVLGAMARIAGEGGAIMVIDEKTDDAFAAPADELTRLLYGFSVFHCLPAGMDVAEGQESAGTGTVMRPATVRAYAEAAGLERFDVLDIENDFFSFYRLR